MKNTSFTIAVLSIFVLSLCACSGDLIPQSANNPQTAQSVSLEMQKQEVKRYDCNGKLTSDKIEVVQSPTDLMELQPTKRSWTYQNISNSNFYDVQTGSSAGLIVNKVRFTIDHGEGYLNMQVATGLNEIRYTFNFDDGTSEQGSRYIKVNYSEKTLSGFQEIHPDSASCQPSRPNAAGRDPKT